MSREVWHIRREITYGHLITTGCVLVSVIFYIARTESGLQLVNLRVDNLQEQYKIQDQKNEAQFQEIKSLLVRIDDKLDRKVDKK